MLFEQCNFVTEGAGGPRGRGGSPLCKRKPIGARIYDCQQMLAPAVCLWMISSNFCRWTRRKQEAENWVHLSPDRTGTRESAAVQGCNRKWGWNKVLSWRRRRWCFIGGANPARDLCPVYYILEATFVFSSRVWIEKQEHPYATCLVSTAVYWWPHPRRSCLKYCCEAT